MELLELGADPNLKSSFGFDTLCTLIKDSHELDIDQFWSERKQLVKRLKDFGCDFDEAVKFLRHHYYGRHTNDEIERLRTRFAALPSSNWVYSDPRPGFDPALRNVVKASDTDQVETLSEIDFRKRYGMVAPRFFEEPEVLDLCTAIEENDLQRIDYLTKENDIASVRGFAGVTPLLWAYPFQRTERIVSLIEAGADPRVKLSLPCGIAGFSRAGFNILSDAAMTAEPPLFDAIVTAMEKRGMKWVDHRNFNGDSIPLSILQGLDRGKSERLQRWIDAGGDLEISDQHGVTALMQAMIMRDAASAEQLLAAGADPHAVCDRHLSAYDFCLLRQHRPANYRSRGAAHPTTLEWFSDQYRVRGLLRALGVDERGHHRRYKAHLKLEDRTTEFTLLTLRLDKQRPIWRAAWYPRQNFAGCGERFQGDRYDLRRYHSWNDWVPIDPKELPSKSTEEIDQISKDLVAELDWLKKRVQSSDPTEVSVER